MYLRIQYQNNKYDYVADVLLDRYLVSNQIKRFFRPSEKRWVICGIDPIRGHGGEDYAGPERRRSLQFPLQEEIA